MVRLCCNHCLVREARFKTGRTREKLENEKESKIKRSVYLDGQSARFRRGQVCYGLCFYRSLCSPTLHVRHVSKRSPVYRLAYFWHTLETRPIETRDRACLDSAGCPWIRTAEDAMLRGCLQPPIHSPVI